MLRVRGRRAEHAPVPPAAGTIGRVSVMRTLPRADGARKTPIPKASASNDDPPYEINGKVMPLDGIKLVVDYVNQRLQGKLTSNPVAAITTNKLLLRMGRDSAQNDRRKAHNQKTKNKAEFLAGDCQQSACASGR